MAATGLSTRAMLTIAVAGLVGALVLGLAGFYVASTREPRYRAEMELAMVPGPDTAPERISDYWEALSRGQASRIAAEVLSHRRWREPAAQVAGVSSSSLRVTAGVVADTSLVTVGVEAPSASAAETAVSTLVREASPTAEQISGPFALQVVQSAEGSAVLVSMPGWQIVGAATAAGALLGAGGALLVARAQARRRAEREWRAQESSAELETRSEAPTVLRESAGDAVSATVPVTAVRPSARPAQPEGTTGSPDENGFARQGASGSPPGASS